LRAVRKFTRTAGLELYQWRGETNQCVIASWLGAIICIEVAAEPETSRNPGRDLLLFSSPIAFSLQNEDF
jgi:hypothetical protein